MADDLHEEPAFGGPLVVGGVMVMTSKLKREGYTDPRRALAAAIERGWLDTEGDSGIAINEDKGVAAICEELVDNPKVKRWTRCYEGRPWEVDVIATLEAIGEAVLEEHRKTLAARESVGQGSNGRWHP